MPTKVELGVDNVQLPIQNDLQIQYAIEKIKGLSILTNKTAPIIGWCNT